MEEFVARKRVSIYLVLICWGFAVAMMRPSFSTMIAGSLLLFMLFVLRFMAHFEGQYILKAAEAEHGALMARATVFKRLAIEAGIAVALFTGLVVLLIELVRHVPWIWYASPSN